MSLIARRKSPLEDFLMRPIRAYDARLAARVGMSTRLPRVLTRNGLTEREEEVLSLLRRGLSNREIATSLWIAESTVKVHVRHIFEKLGVRSRTAAALFRDDAGG
jgi:DNA-binding NarL/FixJ family response regulator